MGPLLLLAGLITLAPLVGDIPGVPTVMGVFVLLTAGQMIFNRDKPWLPEWMLDRSVSRDKLHRAFSWLRRPGRFLDRLTRPRLTIFVEGFGIYMIAIACTLIALVMPVLELIPFSANGAGAALTAFGLSVITSDGLLALLALLFTFVTMGIVIFNLF